MSENKRKGRIRVTDAIDPTIVDLKCCGSRQGQPDLLHRYIYINRGAGQDATATVVAIFLTTRKSVASKTPKLDSVYVTTPGSLIIYAMLKNKETSG